jgi:hypothetical protein
MGTKQVFTPRIIRTVVILLVSAIGVMILLALLPELISIDVSTGPYTQSCATPYIAIKNTSLFPMRLRSWVIAYEGTGYTYVLPTVPLSPGKTVRVWSGAGQNEPYDLYAGRAETTWGVNGLKVQGGILGIKDFYWTTHCGMGGAYAPRPDRFPKGSS